MENDKQGPIQQFFFKVPSGVFLLIFSLALFLDQPLVHAQTGQIPTLLFLGDSLTEGHGVAPEQTYPEILAQMIKSNNQKEVKILNGSESGSTSKSGMARLNWYTKVKVDYVIIALGANDGLRGMKPDVTKKNLEDLIKESKKRNLKTILFGMKMPPNYGPGHTERFAAIFKELAKEQSVPFFPFLLEGIAANKEYNQPDGIHPNEKGHKKMAQNVYDFFKKNKIIIQ